MHSIKNLKVWQESVELATEVYKITSTYPTEEKFGLISQMRRSAVSVASNIAEGGGRSSKKEFHQFLSIASGSSYELETQLVISKNLQFLKKETYEVIETRISIIQKMIYKLQKSLNTHYSIQKTNNNPFYKILTQYQHVD